MKVGDLVTTRFGEVGIVASQPRKLTRGEFVEVFFIDAGRSWMERRFVKKLENISESR